MNRTAQVCSRPVQGRPPHFARVTRPGSRQDPILRLVQVLLLCVGLVAMHQMGHGAHSMVMPAAGAPAVSSHGAMTDAPATLIELAATSGDRLATGPVSGAEATCVAVLLGLLVLAARTVTGLNAAVPAASLPGSGHGTVALGRGPPRLLLAKICVLRT